MRNEYETTVRTEFPTPSNPSTQALTARQREVLGLLCEGLQNKQIARRLNIASATVKIHVANILRILNVSSRLQAAVVAMSLGVVRRCGDARSKPATTVAPLRSPGTFRLVLVDDIAADRPSAHGDWSLEAATG